MIRAIQILFKIQEAIISTTISDDDEIIRILDGIWDQYHGSLDSYGLAAILNDALESHDVVFKPSKSSSYNTILDHLALAKSSYGYLFIAYYGEDFHLVLSDIEIWKEFKKRFRKLLEHELVHYHQYILNNNPNKNQPKIPIDVKNDRMLKDYLSHPYEIMAYARSIVRDFTDGGYSKQDMLDMIKQNKFPKRIEDISIALDKYLKIFPKNDPVLKRLFSYLYQYVQEIG